MNMFDFFERHRRCSRLGGYLDIWFAIMAALPIRFCWLHNVKNTYELYQYSFWGANNGLCLASTKFSTSSQPIHKNNATIYAPWGTRNKTHNLFRTADFPSYSSSFNQRESPVLFHTSAVKYANPFKNKGSVILGSMITFVGIRAGRLWKRLDPSKKIRIRNAIKHYGARFMLSAFDKVVKRVSENPKIALLYVAKRGSYLLLPILFYWAILSRWERNGQNNEHFWRKNC